MVSFLCFAPPRFRAARGAAFRSGDLPAGALVGVVRLPPAHWAKFDCDRPAKAVKGGIGDQESGIRSRESGISEIISLNKFELFGV